MDIDGVEFVKLAPRRSPPDKKDFKRNCFPRTVYFRTAGGQKRIIKKTRYVRSY